MYTPATLDFISNLKENNNKEWFDANKAAYEKARQNHLQVTQDLIGKIAEFEPRLQGMSAKDCVFRIFRDVRFSKDKSPYKGQFGSAIAPGGRKSPHGVYYLHVEPGKSFLAGGSYMPESGQLKKIRQEIDYNLKDFEAILQHKDFKAAFPKGLDDNAEYMLSRPPKDYDKDNPALEYLKRKSFVVHHPLTDAQLLDPDFTGHAATIFRALLPLNRFLDNTLE